MPDVPFVPPVAVRTPAPVETGRSAAGQPPGRARPQGRPAARPIQLRLVHLLWVLMVYEVDLFLTAKTGAPFYLIPTLVAPIVIYYTVSAGKKRALYWPMLLFLAMHVVASVFAPNAGLARPFTKFMVYATLLFASSASFVDTPPKMSHILKLYLLSFAWYGLQGVTRGLVPWHPLLANEDSFGPLMVVAMSFAYFSALATTSKRWRLIGYGMFGLSILGLITSFARGASLAGVAVLLYIFLLSPNKLRTIAYVLGAAIVVLPIAGTMLPLDAYLKEVGSSAQGDEGRMRIWGMAWRVFKSSPVYGAGAGNYGVAAQSIATPEEQEEMWRGYYYLAVHNTAMEILSEEGLIGIALWVTMIVGFFRRNARLRRADARAHWATHGGGETDLRLISLGLDGSMVGYLVSSMFYNQLYIHWFWSLQTISYVLVLVACPAPARAAPDGARRRGSLLPALQRS